MVNYEEARFKLITAQLNQSKDAAKDNTWTTLRITKKNFQEESKKYLR